MNDKASRPYAKLSTLKAGDRVELDAGFTCHKSGIVTLEQDELGLFFKCDEGEHHISGQADNGEDLIGIYNV